MKIEKAKQIANEALETLAAALEAGKSDELKAYLKAMGAFHKYSFRNVCLILRQFPEATQVAGFRTWQKLNRYVRKGERGIAIIVPMFYPKAESDDERDPIKGFRKGYVFDLSQTEGEELPDPKQAKGEPGAALLALKEFTETKGIELNYSDDLGGALGLSSGGKITLLKGRSDAEDFLSLAHELAHELLHKGEARKELSKKVKETEAEAVAFVVGCAVGLELGSFSSDYIQIYQGSKETLLESLERIQSVSSEILEALEPSY